MNYIGSKHSLLQFLYEGITKVVGNRDFVVSDLFSGTGAVGRMFKEKGHKVIANDLQYYSYVLNANYIANHKDLYFTRLSKEIPALFSTEIHNRKKVVCNYLDTIEGVEGYIYANYSLGGTQGQEFQRQYYSDYNAKKCDAIRTKIETRKQQDMITDGEYFFLLATLIEAVDKVANTASVYGAFLKSLKKSAQKEFIMKPAEYYLNDHEHDVFNEDINKLIQVTTHDVVYLDPPYNHRQYSGNYHILETIAKYDNPIIKGVTGMRDCKTQKSNYCSRTNVKKEFTELMKNIQANYVFMSYNDEGLMSFDGN